MPSHETPHPARSPDALARLRAGHDRLVAIHRTHPSPDLSAAIGILGRFLGDAPAAQDARWLAMGEPSRSGAVAALHEPAA